MSFWERTWRERGEAIKQAFGDTWPPETVKAFSWEGIARCPGACALALPPIDEGRDPIRHRRDDWLYLSMGLSQPLDREQVKAERAAGKSYSAYGMEFAFITQKESPWAAEALYYFMTYMIEGEDISWGDRFPFRLHRRSSGELGVCTGNPDEMKVEPVGALRAVLFWPFLFPDWTFVTSTGKFMVMVATGITEREWDLAKQTTTVHLLLLLCRSGIVQRTIPDRNCLMDSACWRGEWDQIAKLSPADCEREIEAGIGRWHLASFAPT